MRNEDFDITYILSISGNGVGIPEDIDFENPNNLGVQPVTSLVDQLGGELELKRNNRTEFIISLPLQRIIIRCL